MCHPVCTFICSGTDSYHSPPAGGSICWAALPVVQVTFTSCLIWNVSNQSSVAIQKCRLMFCAAALDLSITLWTWGPEHGKDIEWVPYLHKWDLLLLHFIMLISCFNSNSLNIKHILPLSLATRILNWASSYIPDHNLCFCCHGDYQSLVINVNLYHDYTFSATVISAGRWFWHASDDSCIVVIVGVFP